MEYIQKADWFSPELDHSPNEHGWHSPNYDYFRPTAPAYSNPIRKGAMYSGVHKDMGALSGVELSALHSMGAIAKMNGLGGFSIAAIPQNVMAMGMPTYLILGGLASLAASKTVLKGKGKKGKMIKQAAMYGGAIAALYGLVSAAQE